jgi:hypothetical protein
MRATSRARNITEAFNARIAKGEKAANLASAEVVEGNGHASARRVGVREVWRDPGRVAGRGGGTTRASIALIFSACLTSDSALP